MRFTLLAAEALAALALLALIPRRARLGRFRALLPGSAGASLVVVFVAALLHSAALLWLLPPSPRFHDEWSYLLQGETFASGRLTNPAPVQPEYFETHHVLTAPTYQSKYPPGPGIPIAFGLWLFESPWPGVAVAFAIACVAVAWMLQAVVPVRWAAIGGLLPLLRFGVFEAPDTDWFCYWIRSAWGGSVAMLGGALLFGGAFRWVRDARASHAAWAGAGLSLLALSRPWEGLMVAVPVVAAVLVPLVREPRRFVSLAGAVVVLVPSFLGLAAYNHAVTGNALLLPHVLYEQSYDVVPHFLWGDVKPTASWRHDDLKLLHYDWRMETWERRQTLAGNVSVFARTLAIAGSFFLGPALAVALAYGVGVLRRPAMRLPICAIVVSLLATIVTVTYRTHPHYLAPAAPLYVLLAVQALRVVRAGRGRAAAQLLGILMLCSLIVCSVATRIDHRSSASDWNRVRAEIQEDLQESGASHLVLVYYGEGHSPHDQWIANGADLAHEQVLWARDLGEVTERELLPLYPDRFVWRLDADAPRRELTPVRAPQRR